MTGIHLYHLPLHLQTSLNLSLSSSGDGFVRLCKKLNAAFKKFYLNRLLKLEAGSCKLKTKVDLEDVR